jgi:signal transduction histidine kinase
LTGCRALLFARAVLAAGVGAAAILGAGDRSRWLLPAVLVTLASLVQAAALGPGPVRVTGLLVSDLAVLLAVLALAGPGPLYLGYAASVAAFGGLLLGLPATAIWAGLLVQTYAVGRTVVGAALIVPAGVAAVLVGSVVTGQARRRAAELATAQREATALERARLARELHDSVAKTVRGMSLAALALPRSVGQQPQLAVQLADAISAAAVAAERETREVLAGLRLDSPDEAFPPALTRLCHIWSAGSGIPVDCRIAPVEPPVPVRYEVVRIVQEALTNTGRHARAGRVVVTLDHDGQWLRLSVRDDGVGFRVPKDLTTSAERDRHGLVGMSERARSVGGRLEIAAEPGRGTTITARLPA